MRRPERAVYLTAGAALSTPSIAWFEGVSELSRPLAYPMILALAMVALLANYSAIERFWFIAKEIRRRDCPPIEFEAASSEQPSIERSGPQVSQHPAKINL
jgi:hypothetical protein